MKYKVPDGPLCLAGAVERPEPGTLPLRGDLAHIALAGSHLAAHYVVPDCYAVTGGEAALHLNPRGDSPAIATLAAGTMVEVLDLAGDWAWGCLGPAGPSGYVRREHLARVAA